VGVATVERVISPSGDRPPPARGSRKALPMRCRTAQSRRVCGAGLGDRPVSSARPRPGSRRAPSGVLVRDRARGRSWFPGATNKTASNAKSGAPALGRRRAAVVDREETCRGTRTSGPFVVTRLSPVTTNIVRAGEERSVGDRPSVRKCPPRRRRRRRNRCGLTGLLRGRGGGGGPRTRSPAPSLTR